MRGGKPKWISAKTPPDDGRTVMITYRDPVYRTLRVDCARYIEIYGEYHWYYAPGDDSVLAWMDLQPCTDPEIIGEVK